MKFVLFFTLSCCLIACSSSDNALPKSQNNANINKTTPSANSQPTVSVNNAISNTAKNTGNFIEVPASLGEKFTLKSGEIGKIKDTGLVLKLITVATVSLPSNTQNSDPTKPTVPLCRIEATLNGKTEGKQLYYNQPGRNEFDFEGFKIQIQNVTPTGKVDCSFIVTKK